MNIFSALSLLGGLALFLYGMTLMGSSLEKLAGGRLERTLEKMTSSRIKAVLLGMGVTAVIQSSSATTVMVVGFVNSGIMKLGQAIGVIMGANIGTTVTSWLLSLTGVESSNVIVKLLNPQNFSPVLAVMGIVMIMAFRSGRKRDIGSVLMGFGILMFGMSAMSAAVKPLAAVPEFTGILTAFSNPLLGVLAGTVLTAVIQSSSASVGILQALASTGSITYSTAIPIIMGQNIGTCVTALISCVGANKNAKRAAMAHLYFNIIGTLLFMGIYYLADALIGLTFADSAVGAAGIAVVHTAFNVLSTVVLLPFSRLLEKLATRTVREGSDEKNGPILDERFLASPSFAIEQCRNAAGKMAELACNSMLESMELMGNYDEKRAAAVMKTEDMLDQYEDKLGTYLVKLSSRELSEADSHEISMLLHCIGDFERIGDHAVNVIEVSEEMKVKAVSFSEAAASDLAVIAAAVKEILTVTTAAYISNDLAAAGRTEPLEQVVDKLRTEIKNRHIERLQSGNCTIQLGFILSDLLTNYERVSDHCSNIAACMIQTEMGAMDSHAYLNNLKTSGSPYYTEMFDEYARRYTLPQAGKTE